MNAEQRIRSFITPWFITEPVLFSVMNTHTLKANDKIKTLRIGKKLLEYNPKFIDKLDDKDLKTLLIFEAFRALTKHPYERKRKNPIANQTGSNVTIQEYLATQLEMPQAKQLFQNLLKKNRSKDQDKFLEQYEQLAEMDDAELESLTGMSKAKLQAIRNSIPDYDESDLNKRHFEFYYNLIDQNLPEMIEDSPLFKGLKDALKSAGEGQPRQGEGEGQSGEGEDSSGSSTSDHFDPMNSLEQTESWGDDELMKNEINDAINNAHITNSWGSVPGKMQDMLIASMKPKVDYRSILRSFRASVISSDTVLNRMRPNRRLGWKYPGKKRNFTTKLAFFVDVSGSMSNETLKQGFSIINRFFSYGIQSIDVFQFDTEVKSEKPVTMNQAKKEFKLMGRGGTDFQCIMDLLEKRGINYDGVIVYTDGYASKPRIPKNVKKNKLLWLYDTEGNYNGAKQYLEGCGKLAYVKSDREY